MEYLLFPNKKIKKKAPEQLIRGGGMESTLPIFYVEHLCGRFPYI